MTKKRVIILMAVLVCLAAIGCAKPAQIRYTQGEIQTFSSDVKERIRNKQVSLGMSATMVRFSWGGPHETRVLNASPEGKFREEWVYQWFANVRTVLVFTDNVLTEILTTEPGIVSGNTIK